MASVKFQPPKPTLNLSKQKGLKYTVLNERLYRYTTASRSHDGDRALDALRAETLAKFPDFTQMQIGSDQGTFMSLLVAATGARRAIEIGTFTGYSAICIARGLPARGRLLCLDLSEEWTAVAQKYWAKAGVAKKIELRLGPAIDSLKTLKPADKFEFAFIDAHKPEYDTYYELLLPHMRPNGLILFDNMLWGGRLGRKSAPRHPSGRAIDELNRKLSRDRRVESMLLTLGDGVQVCRVK